MVDISAKLSGATKFHLVGEAEMVDKDDVRSIVNLHKRGWSIRNSTFQVFNGRKEESLLK